MLKSVLHVGCGQKSKEHLPIPMRGDDWREVRYDINPSVSPDIVGDIRDMSPVATGSVDALFSSHNVEHVFFHEVPQMLREFARVLNPEDGFAIITCPDLQVLGEMIAKGEIDKPVYVSASGPITPLDMLYGHRKSVAQGDVYMAHKTGYTAPLLVRMLKQGGFTSVFVYRSRRTKALWALASHRKLTNGEMDEMGRLYFTAV